MIEYVTILDYQKSETIITTLNSSKDIEKQIEDLLGHRNFYYITSYKLNLKIDIKDTSIFSLE